LKNKKEAASASFFILKVQGWTFKSVDLKDFHQAFAKDHISLIISGGKRSLSSS
jgi:hypothetical protein